MTPAASSSSYSARVRLATTGLGKGILSWGRLRAQRSAGSRSLAGVGTLPRQAAGAMLRTVHDGETMPLSHRRPPRVLIAAFLSGVIGVGATTAAAKSWSVLRSPDRVVVCWTSSVAYVVLCQTHDERRWQRDYFPPNFTRQRWGWVYRTFRILPHKAEGGWESPYPLPRGETMQPGWRYNTHWQKKRSGVHCKLTHVAQVSWWVVRCWNDRRAGFVVGRGVHYTYRNF